MRRDADAEKVKRYLAGLPPGSRRKLKNMRDAIRRAAPGATESISYGIPAFRLDGRVLVYCAAWTSHMSLYPLTASVRRALRDDLDRYESSKGTLRFPLAGPVPVALVTRFVKTRAAESKKKRKPGAAL